MPASPASHLGALTPPDAIVVPAPLVQYVRLGSFSRRNVDHVAEAPWSMGQRNTCTVVTQGPVPPHGFGTDVGVHRPSSVCKWTTALTIARAVRNEHVSDPDGVPARRC